jgi:plasmid stability protein
MAQVIVRNLDEDVKARLQARAARHGQSMEEEIRDILRDAVKGDDAAPPPLGTHIARLFRGLGLDTPIPEQRGIAARPARFDE